ncbi:hypothetical protein UlMin_042400 [Ulmus minor]
MATLYHFPCFLSPSPHKLISLDHQKHQTQRLGWYFHNYPPLKFCRIDASSIKKSSRKVKGNVELCNDIREFVAAVGLPEGYLPTIKDFSQHGRTDLANKVRRRGYKLVGELLSSTKQNDADGSNVKKGIAEKKDALVDLEDKITGQGEEAKVMVGELSLPIEVPIMGNSSGSLFANLDSGSDDYSHVHVEASSDLPLQEEGSFLTPDSCSDENSPVPIEASSDLSMQEKGLFMNIDICSDDNHVPVEASSDLSLQEMGLSDEDGSLSSSVSSMANHPNSDISSSSDSGNDGHMPLETSTYVSSGENEFNGGDEKVNSTVEDEILPTNANSNIDNDLKSDSNTDVIIESADGLSLEGNNLQNSQSEANNMPKEVALSAPEDFSALSLEDKVANFIQYGHLDTLEDDEQGTLNKNGTEEGDIESVQSWKSTPKHAEDMHGKGNTAMEINENALKSAQAATANHPLRDDNLSAEGQSNQADQVLDVETSKTDNQVAISQLKLMLHQKELELSQLKQQIEIEKRALSFLQAKAETEISKAQKLVSEKDTELNAAEETLSGLVEVEIQYRGAGEIVEVTGSFNGWHHRIELEPQQSNITDPNGSSKSKLWSTALWLYPGVYEIKYIVDGQWKIDPERESVTRGSITNNILRVNR